MDGYLPLLGSGGATVAVLALWSLGRWAVAQVSGKGGSGATAQADARGVSVQVGGASADKECSREVERRLEGLDERDRRYYEIQGQQTQILGALQRTTEATHQLLQELVIRQRTER